MVAANRRITAGGLLVAMRRKRASRAFYGRSAVGACRNRAGFSNGREEEIHRRLGFSRIVDGTIVKLVVKRECPIAYDCVSKLQHDIVGMILPQSNTVLRPAASASGTTMEKQ